MAVFYNQATLTYAGGAVRSNIVTGEISASVNVTKTAVSAGYAPGEQAAYAVSIVNDGAAALTGMTLTDDLGGYAFEGGTLYPLAYVPDSLRLFVNGVLQTTPEVTAGPPMTVSGVSVPAGGSAVLVYEAAVTPFAPLGAGSAITNTVTVAGGGLASALTASAALDFAQESELTIVKSLEPTYTFVIQNAGSQAGEEAAIVITDVFDPVLRDVAVSLNGTPLAGADYTYDETTGAFATVSGAVTVPAAAYAQNADGTWTLTPGVAVLTVSGIVG